MKKILLIAASAMLVLASCTNDESAPEQNEIGFKAITMVSSKAIQTVGALPTTESFKIWGYSSKAGDFSEINGNTPSNFMSNLKIEYITTESDSKWRNAAKRYYWPSTGQIGFYAMYPSTVIVDGIPDYFTNGIKLKDYVISNDTKFQDLMFGYVESGSTGNALSLTFRHALSQILINVKTAAKYDDVNFYVTGIELQNIDNTADYQFALNAIDHSNKVFTYKEIWTENDVVADQDDNLVYDAITFSSYNSEFMKRLLTDESKVYAAASPIVVIPQNLKVSSAENPSVIPTRLKITYRMAQGVDTSNPLDGIGDDVNEGTVYVNLKTTTHDKWEVGKKYVYTLSFNLNEINFDPEVAGWISLATEQISFEVPAIN